MKELQWNSILKKLNGLKHSKNEKSSALPRRAANNNWEIYVRGNR